MEGSYSTNDYKTKFKKFVLKNILKFIFTTFFGTIRFKKCNKPVQLLESPAVRASLNNYTEECLCDPIYTSVWRFDIAICPFSTQAFVTEKSVFLKLTSTTK